MHSSILFFVVFMGGLRWGVGAWHPGHPSPAARELPSRGAFGGATYIVAPL